MIGDRFRRIISAGVLPEAEKKNAGSSGTAAISAAKRRDTARAVEYLARFFIGFVLSGAHIFNSLSPFSVGLVAAANGPGAAVCSLLGSIIGYLMFGSFIWAIKYISAAILICTVLIVFRETSLFSSVWFMPLAAALVMACVGFVSAAEAGWSLVETALLTTDCILTGGCAYFYNRALSPWNGNFGYEYNSEIVHLASVLILLSTALISLSSIQLFGLVSIGRTAAVLVVFIASYKGGVGLGCVAGVAIGLAMDAASGGAAVFGTAYGFAGLIAGVFTKRGRLGFAVSFILVDAAAALLSIGSAGVPAILYETFAASVIFMLLPNSFLSRAGALLPQSGRGSGAIRAREYTKNHVEQASQAFRDLYETVKSKSGRDYNDADIATVFARASEQVCRKCVRSSICWQTQYQSTLDVMNNLTGKMTERGKLEESDFPAFFAGECKNLRDYITAVNAELRALLYRRQYRNRLRENQNAAFNQYSEISSILSGISLELGNGIRLEPELEDRLLKYLHSLGIQAETAVFRDRGGRIRAEISGAGLGSMKNDVSYLDKLSAVLGTRICASDSGSPDKLIVLEAEPLAAGVGISCLKKEGQEVSGDKGAYFKTDEGILHVILSDGMGTGKSAARYSGDTVRILERFLRSGIAAETAVRMLNDLLLLKNEDDTGCATVDLVSINLFTGQTNMFKYGAAPSYLRQKGAIRRVRGKSLAAGLGIPPHDAPDHIKMELKSGSIAVIVSDGVSNGGDDGWLEDIIIEHTGTNPLELSKKIIDAAVAKSGKEDDMTVIAIQMMDRD